MPQQVREWFPMGLGHPSRQSHLIRKASSPMGEVATSLTMFTLYHGQGVESRGRVRPIRSNFCVLSSVWLTKHSLRDQAPVCQVLARVSYELSSAWAARAVPCEVWAAQKPGPRELRPPKVKRGELRSPLFLFFPFNYTTLWAACQVSSARVLLTKRVFCVILKREKINKFLRVFYTEHVPFLNMGEFSWKIHRNLKYSSA